MGRLAFRRCLMPVLAAALLGCGRDERIPKPPPSTPRPVTSLSSAASHCPPPACAAVHGTAERRV